MSTTFKIKDGDIDIDNRGWVKMTSGLEKLSQDIFESLLSDSYSGSPLNSKLTEFLGVVETPSTKLEVESEMHNIETNIRILQSSQSNLELNEALKSIENIDIDLNLGKLAVYFDSYAEDGSYKPNSMEIVMDELEIKDIQG